MMHKILLFKISTVSKASGVFFSTVAVRKEINASISKSALNLPKRDLGSSWDVYRWHVGRKSARWVAIWTLRRCTIGWFSTDRDCYEIKRDGFHCRLSSILQRLSWLFHGVLNGVLPNCKKEASILFLLFPFLPTAETYTVADTKQPGRGCSHPSHMVQIQFFASSCARLPSLSSYVCRNTR